MNTTNERAWINFNLYQELYYVIGFIISKISMLNLIQNTKYKFNMTSKIFRLRFV